MKALEPVDVVTEDYQDVKAGDLSVDMVGELLDFVAHVAEGKWPRRGSTKLIEAARCLLLTCADDCEEGDAS